jgi:hypothetical protein
VKVKDALAGKKVMCPKCEAVLVVPTPKPAEPARADTVAKAPTSPTPSAASPPAASSVAAAALPPGISHDQLAAAFKGRIQPPQVSFPRKLGTVLVLVVLILLVLFYAGVLVALAGGFYWLATSDFGPSIPSAVVSVGMAAAGILLLSLLRPVIVPNNRVLQASPLPADRQRLLAEFVGKVCEQLDAPPPKTIQTECSPRLAADSGGSRLTIGLPLLTTITIEQLGGLVAAQLAPYRRRAGAGAANLIRAINGWMWRSVYQDDRFDRWIKRSNVRPGMHFGRLLLPLRVLSFAHRVVLWIPMFIGNTVAASLARESELDADRAAARLIGAKSWAATIDRAKVINFTYEGILTELPFLYKEQQLPDSLPHHLAERMNDVTPELAATLVQSVIKEEDIPFDSRPSDADRQAAIAAEPATAVLVCSQPASALMADFTRLSREVTFDYYAGAFGAQLVQTSLRKMQLPGDPPPAVRKYGKIAS